MELNAYLAFNGQCEQAFKFYERCLRGTIEMMMTHGDSPMAAQTPPESRSRIMHARLRVGDAVLMGSDAPPQFASKPQGFCVSISVKEPAEAERVFSQLGEGGTMQMPIQETFWAQRFGMLIDRFGIPWMVNCEKADVTAG
jgi:PhnB protein